MPAPSSVTAMRRRPPPSVNTSTRRAPASSAFSINSLTTLAGRSTTSPAAMRLMIVSGSWRTGMRRLAASNRSADRAPAKSAAVGLRGRCAAASALRRRLLGPAVMHVADPRRFRNVRQLEHAGLGERGLGVVVARLPVLFHGEAGEFEHLARSLEFLRLV